MGVINSIIYIVILLIVIAFINDYFETRSKIERIESKLDGIINGNNNSTNGSDISN